MLDSRYLEYIVDALYKLGPINKSIIKDIINQIQNEITKRTKCKSIISQTFNPQGVVLYIHKEDWGASFCIDYTVIEGIYRKFYSVEEIVLRLIKQIGQRYLEDTLWK